MKKFYFILLGIFYIGCNSNNSTRSNEKILKECFDYVVNDSSQINKKCLFVAPTFHSLLIQDYSERIINTFEKYDLYEDRLNIMSETNDLFENKYSNFLRDLNYCNQKSHKFLWLSGVSNHLVIGNVYSIDRDITFDEHIANDIDVNTTEIEYFFFFLNDKKEIVEVVKDGVIFN